MKAFYPRKLDQIFHFSKTGTIYQLDSFRKLIDIHAALNEIKTIEIETVDHSHIDAEVFSRFHTLDFVQALVQGKDRENVIESSGVFWQPYLPLAMTNVAYATIKGLQYLVDNQGDLSITICDGGHHTTPFQAFGFGPISAAGIAINTILSTKKNVKISILDLDVHQGNGFTHILNENVSIYDLWNKRIEKGPILNNPQYHSYFVTDAKSYFPTLDKIFETIINDKPEIIIYYSGVDVLEDDRMSGIQGFTLNLLKEREDKVFSFLKQEGIKTMVSIGGGYVDYSDKEKAEENQMKLTQKHMITIESAIKSFMQ